MLNCTNLTGDCDEHLIDPSREDRLEGCALSGRRTNEMFWTLIPSESGEPRSDDDDPPYILRDVKSEWLTNTPGNASFVVEAVRRNGVTIQIKYHRKSTVFVTAHGDEANFGLVGSVKSV